MKEHITKLRYRAIMRSRTYFLQTVSQLRQPKTNVRMIQINSLLKYTPLMDFLLDAQPDVYFEIRDSYTDSMSKTLHALFRTYAAQLSLLEHIVSTRKDVIAVEDGMLRDVWTRVDMGKRGDAFCLGERLCVLELEDGGEDDRSSSTTNNNTVGTSGSGNGGLTPMMRRDSISKSRSASQSNITSSTINTIQMPILAHVSLAEGKKHPYEIIFKSVMLHLMDSVTNEFVFVRQFFKENGPHAFEGIYKRTLHLLLEQLENYLFNCFDCIGLLLMIKITHANKRIMKERKVNVLDTFLDSITKLLWSRLKTAMGKQLRSVRSGNVQNLGTINLHAHYVSRRYAEFTCSILLILYKGNKGLSARAATAANANANSSATIGSEEGGGGGVKHNRRPSSSSLLSEQSKISKTSHSHRGSAGDMLVNDISHLQDEIILLIERLAESHTSNKKKIVFLINNIDQIISIFQERRVPGKEMNRFVDLLMQQRELFVEDELLQNFSKMIAFVQQTEQHMNQTQNFASGSSTSKIVAENHKVEVNVQVVESLVLEFASTWKSGIEQINRDVLSFFANFRNGMEILKQVLTQLLLYYTRFQDIIRKVWRSKPPAFCKDLVSTSSILIEIKKYALAI